MGRFLPENGFKRFLECEAERNPLRIEGRIDKDEVLREAAILAKRMIEKDVALIMRFWRDKDYQMIAFMLKKYGLEFKGIIYIEELIKELLRILGAKVEVKEDLLKS